MTKYFSILFMFVLVIHFTIASLFGEVPTPFPAPLQVTSYPVYGLDLLGLAKLDAETIAKQIDNNSAIGALAGTFGDIRPNLARLLDTQKVVAVRIHLIDGTPLNHACAGNVTSLSLLKKKIALVKNLMQQYANVTVYLSPVLEYSCKDQNIVNAWFALINHDYPTAIPVCSTNGQGFCPSGVLKEMHGGGSGDVVSGDGVSTFDTNSIKYRSAGKYLVLSWHNCCNGRLTSEKQEDYVPPPPLRKNFCVTDETEQLVRILRPPPPTPTLSGCPVIDKPDINKPRSENYGSASKDTRQNKNAMILTKKFSKMSIQRLDGKEVGCFLRYDPPATTGYRYYEGNCSGKNPIQLMDSLGGNEWGKVVSGKSCYIFNSIRRLGVYR